MTTTAQALEALGQIATILLRFRQLNGRRLDESEIATISQHINVAAAEIARLQAECEALRKDAEWRPIKTAPKDGTHILLANKAGASEGGWLSDIDHGADWEGQIGMAGWWRADGTDWPCTHWQPLPAPPAALSTSTAPSGAEE